MLRSTKKKTELKRNFKGIIKPYEPEENESKELRGRMNKLDQEKFNLLTEDQKLQDISVLKISTDTERVLCQGVEACIDQVHTVIHQYAQKNKIGTMWYFEDFVNVSSYNNKSKKITSDITYYRNDK